MTARKLQPYQVVLLRQMARERFPRKFLRSLFGLGKNVLNHVIYRVTYKDIK